jgi:hypothetical protein
MTPSDPRVYFGPRMHLFYRRENVVNQSTGALYRSDKFGTSSRCSGCDATGAAPTGGDVVVLVPPNASPSRHDQPAWWHISGPLEYDLAMRELRGRGVATIDLKAASWPAPIATCCIAIPIALALECGSAGVQHDDEFYRS